MDKISQKNIYIVKRNNIVKTTKTKYAITNFLWWNLKIKFKTILEWENLSGGKIFEWKKIGKFLKITWNPQQKVVLYTLVHLVNLSCTVNVIPCTITQITQNFIFYVLIFVGNVLMK